MSSRNPLSLAEDLYNEGLALSDSGQYKEAIGRFDRAIQLDPNHGDWFRSRSFTRYQIADYVGSASDFDEAIRCEPDNAGALNSRAWLLATCPDAKVRNGQQAITDANKACELSDWTVAEWIDTLAAAHAEAGNLEEAIRRQKQAMAIAGDTEEHRYVQRLRLYESGKPFRQN